MVMNFLTGAIASQVFEKILGSVASAGGKIVKDKIEENFGGEKSEVDERNYTAMRHDMPTPTDLKPPDGTTFPLWNRFIASTNDPELFPGAGGVNKRLRWLTRLRVTLGHQRQERPVRDVKEFNEKGKVIKTTPTPDANFISLDVKMTNEVARFFENEEQKCLSSGKSPDQAEKLARDETLKQFDSWGLPRPSESDRFKKVGEAIAGLPGKLAAAANAATTDEAIVDAKSRFQQARDKASQ